LKEVKEDRIPLIAGGMAYYAFLAIFPAVIAAIGILGLVGGTPHDLLMEFAMRCRPVSETRSRTPWRLRIDPSRVPR